MKLNNDKIIKLWGILDLAAIGWYVFFSIIKGGIPFYSDVLSAKSASISFGASMPIIVTAISLFLYFTLLISGSLLLKGNKYGAILSYIQCPFRLLTLMPSSLFFITYPVKYIFGVPVKTTDPIQFITQAPIIVLFTLILLSEILKTITVIRWHIQISRSL